MCVGPSITTTTFFKGNSAEASTKLKENLVKVMKANPWLACTLAKATSGPHKLEMVYSGVFNESQIDKFFNPTAPFVTSKAPVLDSNMDFCTTCTAVSNTSAEVKKGSDTIGLNEPQIVLSVIPDSKTPTERFTVIFSISHVIVDGFTYYKLMDMLSSAGEEISTLNCVRKHEIQEQGDAAMGKDETAYMYSGAVICNVVGTMLCNGTKPLIESYYIDMDRVNKIKEKEKADSGVDYVSTNDVICSNFAGATNARTLLMPINFRDKLPTFTSNDAGNYEGALVFGYVDYVMQGLCCMFRAMAMDIPLLCCCHNPHRVVH
jgi:hypothetical protein